MASFMSPTLVSGQIVPEFKQLNLLNLSSTTYYPVLLNSGHYHTANKFQICRGYAEAGFDLAYLNVEFRLYGNSWGGSQVALLVDHYNEAYRNTLGLLGFRGYYHPIVWLKGAMLYYYRTDFDMASTIITSPTLVRNSGDQYDYGVGPLTQVQVDAHPNRLSQYLGTSSSSYGVSVGPTFNNTGYP